MTSYYEINVESENQITHSVSTVVTNSPSAVDDWISATERLNVVRVVGLDVEWRPSFTADQNRVAVLQLAVGRRCLVFQLLRAHHFPPSLRRFLSAEGYTFAGVGIQADVDKLYAHHGLVVQNAVDLAPLAAEVCGDPRLRSAGLKALAERVLGVEMEKPKRVTLSAWDHETLSDQQVRYAVADAFLSFEIGRVLRAWRVQGTRMEFCF